MHLLDTVICIALLNGKDSDLQRRIVSMAPEDVCICSVVKGELLFGARNSAQVSRNLERLRRFFAPLQSAAFEDAAAEQYGLLRAHLSREGKLIGGNDMLIASICLAQDCTLVTRNVTEFSRVPGLRIVAW
ncbi:MAG: type II toxin-antitoxin system VapC family toxin [Candidatus Xenobia bacterium]